MFKKTWLKSLWLTLVLALCIPAASAWAGIYSVSLNIRPLGNMTVDGYFIPLVGGTVKVRTLDSTTPLVTLTNGTKYAVVPSEKTAEVEIVAAESFQIASVTKQVYGIVDGVPRLSVPQPVVLDGPYRHIERVADSTDPLLMGKSQFLVVEFKLDVWQLQVQNDNDGGGISITRGADTQKYFTVRKPMVKNFTTFPVTVTADADDGNYINYVMVNGVKLFQPEGTVHFSKTLVPGGGRIRSFKVGYKKREVLITTHNGEKVTVGGREVLKDLGIAPVNPYAPVYGTVRLIVTPTGPNNLVTAVKVENTDGSYCSADVMLTDRFGYAVTLPHKGPVKVTISSLTAPLTVTAHYGSDGAEAPPRHANCTLTCHVDSSLAPTVRDALTAAVDKWQASRHRSSGDVDCLSCHQGMPGPDFSSSAAKEALCASCHTMGATPSHTAEQKNCSTCHSAFGDSHNPAAPATHPLNMPLGSCEKCHADIAERFASSQHATRKGKDTWYGDNLNNAAAPPLQRGFGSYVNVAYASLACTECHDAAAWTPAGGSEEWSTLTGGRAVCQDCHGNRSRNVDTTPPDAPVANSTCYGCHRRQASERENFGLTDVHGMMACSSCHTTTDLHGEGAAEKSMFDPGSITAACANCHGADKTRGPISQIAEHTIHMYDIDCSTCHIQSVVACYNCHFDNEGLHDGVTHQKFTSGNFGGQGAKSWRFLVNRVMPDGSTKIFPGSMQSLMADVTAKGDGSTTEDEIVGDGKGVTFVAIASYYSHSVTKVDSLRCSDCHGTTKVTALALGQPVDVVRWKGNEGEVVSAADMGTRWQSPQGVIPVPPNTSLLNFDFVDVTDPAAPWDVATGNIGSPRILFKRGADVIHMPEAYVKPLTQEQMEKLADPQLDYTSAAVTTYPDRQLPRLAHPANAKR